MSIGFAFNWHVGLQVSSQEVKPLLGVNNKELSAPVNTSPSVGGTKGERSWYLLLPETSCVVVIVAGHALHFHENLMPTPGQFVLDMRSGPKSTDGPWSELLTNE